MIKSKLTGLELTQPLYNSPTSKSITSLSKIIDHPVCVYYDDSAGHLQTLEIPHIENYYDIGYEIYNQSEEDDILYKVENGKKIYRQQHQIETLLSKLSVFSGMKILDYGCAKGTVMKRLKEKSSDIQVYLFDVSKIYEHLWEKFLGKENFTSYQVKAEWEGQMDVVTSFFAFEHLLDPVSELKNIGKLLKDQGLAYIVVPNVFQNYADFIVSDHIHHFSESSLRYVFIKAGFEVVEIDADSHFGAFIVIGKKLAMGKQAKEFIASTEELENIKKESQKIADYWNNLQQKILMFEKEHKGAKAAIYGGGVYGNFIATNLLDTSPLLCFVDQNELLYDEMILGKPVVSPQNINDEVSIVYVGLNPKIAKDVIYAIESWKDKKLEYLFL